MRFRLYIRPFENCVKNDSYIITRVEENYSLWSISFMAIRKLHGNKGEVTEKNYLHFLFSKYKTSLEKYTQNYL